MKFPTTFEKSSIYVKVKVIWGGPCTPYPPSVITLKGFLMKVFGKSRVFIEKNKCNQFWNHDFFPRQILFSDSKSDYFEKKVEKKKIGLFCSFWLKSRVFVRIVQLNQFWNQWFFSDFLSYSTSKSKTIFFTPTPFRVITTEHIFTMKGGPICKIGLRITKFVIHSLCGNGKWNMKKKIENLTFRGV